MVLKAELCSSCVELCFRPQGDQQLCKAQEAQRVERAVLLEAVQGLEIELSKCQQRQKDLQDTFSTAQSHWRAQEERLHHEGNNGTHLHLKCVFYNLVQCFPICFLGKILEFAPKRPVSAVRVYVVCVCVCVVSSLTCLLGDHRQMTDSLIETVKTEQKKAANQFAERRSVN